MNCATWITSASLAASLLAAGVGCASHDGGGDGSGALEAGARANGPTERSTTVTVHASLVVERVREAMASVRALVSERGGYVEEAHYADDAGSRADLVARVPAAKLEGFREALGQLGRVAAETERVEDVTDRRADLGARIRNARAREQRLLQLLSTQTGSLTDVLAVDDEISGVRESLERMEAQQETLEEEIAYASVHVDLDARYVAQWKEPRSSIANAARRGLETAWSFAVGLVVFSLSVGPTVAMITVLLGALWFAVRFARRFRRRIGTAG